MFKHFHPLSEGIGGSGVNDIFCSELETDRVQSKNPMIKVDPCDSIMEAFFDVIKCLFQMSKFSGAHILRNGAQLLFYLKCIMYTYCFQNTDHCFLDHWMSINTLLCP